MMSKNGKKPKALIFDVDGVLFDTEPLHRKAWAKVFEEERVPITDEELLPWTGVSCRVMAADVKKLYALKPEPKELVRRKTEAFEPILRSELTAFPGLDSTLAPLERTFTLRFATGSTRGDVTLMLSLTGLDGFFKTGVTSDDVQNLKPHPETYLKAIETTGCLAHECLAIEDSPTGLRAAKAAGLTVLGVCSSYGPDTLKDADYIFPDTLSACLWLLSL